MKIAYAKEKCIHTCIPTYVYEHMRLCVYELTSMCGFVRPNAVKHKENFARLKAGR